MALVASAYAAADSAVYSATIGGFPRTAETTIVDQGTISYVSLSQIILAFGGTTSIQPDRIQIDLTDSQAWLKLNEKSVNSALNSFDLRQPVLRQGESILMAVTDVQAFLLRAFGISAEQAIKRDTDSSAGPGISVDELTGMDREPAPGRPPGIRQVTHIERVIIDPGHGGEDPGLEMAPGGILGNSGVKEKDVALAVAMKLRSQLENELGLQVRLTRDEDFMLSDSQRVTLANDNANDILISLHAGASYSETAAGVALFHSRTSAGLRAAEIAESISAALAEATGSPGRGVREVPLSLFNELRMPGVLIELGFLTNPTEAALLADEDYQDKLAAAMAEGLRAFTKAPEAPAAE